MGFHLAFGIGDFIQAPGEIVKKDCPEWQFIGG